MPESTAASQDETHLQRVTESVVRVGLLLLLLAWCFGIVRPFITPVVWGMVLAVAVFPAHRWLTARAGGRPKVAAALLGATGIAIVIIPTVLFANSLIETGRQLSADRELEAIAVPPPQPEVKDWPLVGGTVFEIWRQANQSLEPFLVQYAPQLRDAALWVFGATVGTGLAIAQSLLSIVIAAVMLVGAPRGTESVNRLAVRLAGPSGEHITELAARTIRSVALGIVGVAIIQASLVAVGFLAAGVPHAGVWALLCLILAVLQLPPILVVGPVIFYVFSTASLPVAVAFTVWELAASSSDAFLKPILLARGVEVPMLVIFMGAIGGFMMSGFIGLFLGAVVLSVGYELAAAWVAGGAEAALAAQEEGAEA